MLSHDDPRFVPLSVHEARVEYGRTFAVPQRTHVAVNLTAAPMQTTRTMGPHKSELVRKPRGTQRWYVTYVPYGMRFKHTPPIYSEPFKTEKAALRHALSLLDTRDAFRADVVKG